MANISQYLARIKSAIYGEEVRGSIHDAIEAMNVESNAAMHYAATAKDSAKASAQAAKTSETNALASEQAAKTSETNAKNSETSASNSAATAASKATAASSSADKAKTSENKALASEQAAKFSETNAANSETAAKASANRAASSAANAKVAETNAAETESSIAQQIEQFKEYYSNLSKSCIFFGVCDTEAAETEKIVSSESFALGPGAVLIVLFTKPNTADGFTLNVNENGAIPVVLDMENGSPALKWDVGRVLTFVYSEPRGEWFFAGDGVPVSRQVNGKPLSADITLSASDVGARPNSWTPTAADVGAAPASHGTHVTYSTTTPKAAGIAAVGTEAGLARGDHVHPVQTSVTGNAGTATKLQTARTIRTNLAATTSADFDGSANIAPGVTGTLPIGNGGTGATTASAALTNLGAVPTIRKVNSKALSADITLNAADVGAAPASHGTHVTYSTTTPKAAGTASAGKESGLSRGDHVHPAQTSVTGNAGTATKLATSRTIDGLSFNGTANVSRYAVCSTAANDAAKTVTVSNLSVALGTQVTVYFNKANTAVSPTLNVNGTGAHPIYYKGSPLSADNYWAAGSIITFVLSANLWHIISGTKLSASDVGAVPTTRKVNGKALSSDITLNANDVGVRNLNQLINWYFPHLINQRRIQSVHTGANMYFFDCWHRHMGTGDISVRGDGVTISGESNTYFIVSQIIENSQSLIGEQLTVSILTADGKLYYKTGKVTKTTGSTIKIATDFGWLEATVNNSYNLFVGIGVNGGSSVTVAAVKLELGPVQTLAYQKSDGTWALNDPPPNKALELAKCQRYQQVIENLSENGNSGLALGITNGTTIYCSIPLSVPLRAKPTIKFSSTGITAYRGVAGEHPVITALEVYGYFNNSVYLAATPEKKFDPKDAVYLEMAPGAQIILDANL